MGGCPPGTGSRREQATGPQNLQIEDQVVEPFLRDAVVQAHCGDRRGLRAGCCPGCLPIHPCHPAPLRQARLSRRAQGWWQGPSQPQLLPPDATESSRGCWAGGFSAEELQVSISLSTQAEGQGHRMEESRSPRPQPGRNHCQGSALFPSCPEPETTPGQVARVEEWVCEQVS